MPKNQQELEVEDDIAPDSLSLDDTIQEDDDALGGDSGGAGTEEETIADLRQKLADEKTAREAEEKLRRAAEGQLNEISQSVDGERRSRLQAQKDSVETSLNSKEADLADAERRLAEALETGDSVKAAALNKEMNEIQFDMRELKHQKRQIDKAVESPAPAQVQKVSPKTQEWIDEHPRFTEDEEYRATAVAAHTLALEKGHKIESKGYFKFVDDYLARKMPDEDDVSAPANRRAPEDDPSGSAAPAARGNGGAQNNGSGNGRKQTIVKLTQEQREAADFMDMSYEDYARSLQEENARGARK